MKRTRLREFILTSVGSLAILALLFGLLFLAMSLDDSPNKCATKVATKVYDPACF